MKTCKHCKQTKQLSEFHKSHVTSHGTQVYKARCKPCANEYHKAYYKQKDEAWRRDRTQKTRERYDDRWHKNYRLRVKYGLTIEQFESMYQEQAGRCFICATPVPDNEIRVDHDHKSGKVRSLLCHNCNTGLGHFRDDVTLLDLAKQYLENHS